MYSSAVMRRCRPHSGQTLSAFSNFSRRSMCPQPSHFSQASGGISNRSRCDVRGFRSFLNHAITAIGVMGVTRIEGTVGIRNRWNLCDPAPAR